MDGVLYTRDEFIAEYGGTTEWEQAGGALAVAVAVAIAPTLTLTVTYVEPSPP